MKRSNACALPPWTTLRTLESASLAFESDESSTFLIKRFDRAGSRRIHFTSAMALLGKTDGEGAEGTSYLDIASFTKANGATTKQDLKELWKPELSCVPELAVVEFGITKRA